MKGEESQPPRLAEGVYTKFVKFVTCWIPEKLFLRKNRRPIEERAPDAECRRAGRVDDELADKSFDIGAFEDEDDSLCSEKDAVSAKRVPLVCFEDSSAGLLV